MLDAAQTDAAAHWSDALVPGDVVLFRFPLAEEDGTEEPKIRPCLVFDVCTLGSERFIVLAYGTTSDRHTNRGYEVRVKRPESLSRIGLHRPTRFVGARRLTVAAAHPSFVVSPAGSPILGQLPRPELKRLNAIRARLHAERDIAAARREERRSRRRSAVRGVDFMVEHRHPRRRTAPALDLRS